MKKTQHKTPQNLSHAAEVEAIAVAEQQLSKWQREQNDKAERRARLAQLNKDENAEQEARIKQVQKQDELDTRPRSHRYTQADITNAPKPIVVPPPTAEELKAKVRPATRLISDPWADTLPPTLREGAVAPVAEAEQPKPSTRQQPKPAAERPAMKPRFADPYAERDEVAKRAAELQIRPVPTTPEDQLMDCPVCSDRVSQATAFHTRADGTRCIIDKAFALREGVIA
jgi:hypothetical protein